jgi:hypothetical protein
MSQSLGIGYLTYAAMSQSPAPLGNGKKLENRQYKQNYFEKLPNITIFSLPTPSLTSSDSTMPSTTITALEMRSTMTIFAQKHEKKSKNCLFPPKPSLKTLLIAL